MDHPLPIIIDGEPEWEVKEIVDSRWHQRRFQYLVKWKGYGREHNSWESASKVSAPELIVEFHRKYPRALKYVRHAEFDNIFHSKSTALDDPIPGRKPQAPPPPIVVDREPEWEVEECKGDWAQDSRRILSYITDCS